MAKRKQVGPSCLDATHAPSCVHVLVSTLSSGQTSSPTSLVVPTHVVQAGGPVAASSIFQRAAIHCRCCAYNQAPENEGAAGEAEAPRRTRRQKQAAAADAEPTKQQQQPARSTRSRARQQQQQQQQDANDIDLEHAEEQEQQQQQQAGQDEVLDDFQHDAELADSIQGLLQQSIQNPVLLLQQNPDMCTATRRAAKVRPGDLGCE